jgi:hypothetical protein
MHTRKAAHVGYSNIVHKVSLFELDWPPPYDYEAYELECACVSVVRFRFEGGCELGLGNLSSE